MALLGSVGLLLFNGLFNGLVRPASLRHEVVVLYVPEMLMVIFGAGASYDSSREFPTAKESPLEVWRPPRAIDLFRDSNHWFGDIVARYPRLHPILGRLREPQSGRSLEEELQCILDEAHDNEERTRQLMAARYYLRDLLYEVSENWRKRVRFTNYAPLIDQILQSRRRAEAAEPTALVTFNYDTLLDRALESFGYEPKQIENHFQAHSVLKLFKPHGSVDWSRFVEVCRDLKVPRPREARYSVDQLIANAHLIVPSEAYRVVSATDPHQIHNFDRPIIPAIAIPTQTKTDDTFEWPPAHRAYLEELIPKVTKILLVGWQAREAHFAQMLRAGLKKNSITHIMVVGRDHDDAETIFHHFWREIDQQPSKKRYLASGGFSEFVVKGEVEEFIQAQ